MEGNISLTYEEILHNLFFKSFVTIYGCSPMSYIEKPKYSADYVTNAQSIINDLYFRTNNNQLMGISAQDLITGVPFAINTVSSILQSEGERYLWEKNNEIAPVAIPEPKLPKVNSPSKQVKFQENRSRSLFRSKTVYPCNNIHNTTEEWINKKRDENIVDFQTQTMIDDDSTAINQALLNYPRESRGSNYRLRASSPVMRPIPRQPSWSSPVRSPNNNGGSGGGGLGEMRRFSPSKSDIARYYLEK